MKVHNFESTGEAYDMTQCDEGIKTGDILVIEREGVVGIATTWPFAVTRKSGHLHGIKPDYIEKLKLEFPTFVTAQVIAAELGYPLLPSCPDYLAPEEIGGKVKILNDEGMIWAIRIVRKGDKYGSEFDCKHESSVPLIEFYDCRYEHTIYGQFVSRYALPTLLEGDQERNLNLGTAAAAYGLNLDGGIPSWKISGKGMQRVRAWAREVTNG